MKDVLSPALNRRSFFPGDMHWVHIGIAAVRPVYFYRVSTAEDAMWPVSSKKKNDDSQNGDDNKNKKVRAITWSAEDVMRLVASIIRRGSGDDHIVQRSRDKIEITNFLLSPEIK